MKMSFKRVIDIKHFRFSAGASTLEKWIYQIIWVSLENPLLTTLITMTAGAIFFALMLLLVVIFAGVICLIGIILLIEGLLLVIIMVAVCLLTVMCSYTYVVGITLSVYFTTPEDKEPLETID